MSIEAAGPLSGIRVVEVADSSGAYCGKLLADLGAGVVKVEPPEGDPTRRLGPFYQDVPGPDRSLVFWHYHANKQSVVIDPRADAEPWNELLAAADVLLLSGNPTALARRSLDPATLQAAQPHLIVAAVSPFGQSGPRCEWKSCDTVAQAVGGMLFVNGHAGEPPLRGFGLQAYHSASTYAAIGIVLALLARRRTQRGQLVDVSLQEAVAATVEHVSGFLQQTGEIEVRRGTLHWSRYFRVGQCRDGYVLHCSLGDWTSLLEWVKGEGGAQDLAEPAWDEVDHRRRYCEHLFDVLDGWAGSYLVDELVDGAQLRRIPYAPVRSLESLPSHPQLAARGFFTRLAHPELGIDVTYPGAPYQFSATPWALRHAAPVSPSLPRSDTLRLAQGERKKNEKPGRGSALLSLSKDEPVEARGGDLQRAANSLLGKEGEPETGRRVLTGVRVLDFTWVVAGPVATRILADHGAEVIKIERRDAMDFGSRRGGLSGNLNRGKRSVVVNMADARGVALVRDLVRQADLVVDNFSSRVMANWGLDYAGLRAIKPDIIALSMSGFGHSGPQKDYVSYGPTLQALTGQTLAMRHPGGEPAGWGFSYSDMAGGYHGALAALCALWHRAGTGEGQFIDLSQLESLTALLGTPLLALLANGGVELSEGNRSPEAPAAPHGVYPCRERVEDGSARDRWCAIAVFTEDEWRGFVRAIGAPAWTAAPRFRTLASRLAHAEELDHLVAQWTRTRTAEEAVENLQHAGVAAGVVANARDLCERDRHLGARGYWAIMTTQEGARAQFDGVPARLSANPGAVLSPGPLLGEHTGQILHELLGLAPETIAQLRADGVIG